MLDDLAPTALPRLLRRTVWSALVLGTAGFVVAVLITPLAGLGEALGVVLAILNLRQTDRQIAHMEVRAAGEGDPNVKALRRQLRPKVLGRLAIVTVVVFAALFLSKPLGLGIVAGLIIYYVVFVLNVYGVVANQRGLD